MKLLNRLFIALTIAGLATTLIALNAHAGGLAFDRAGNLFEAHGHAIFKSAGRLSIFQTLAV